LGTGGLADEIRSWRPIYRCLALGAAAAFAFGVFAAACFYMLGEYRGHTGPTSIVLIATLWTALVVAPLERRWGWRGIIAAAVLSIGTSLALMPIVFAGLDRVVDRFREYPVSALMWLFTLPILSVGSGSVFAWMIGCVRRNDR